MKKIYHITAVPLTLFKNVSAFQKFLEPKAMRYFEKVQKRGQVKDFRIEFTQSKKDQYRKTITCNLIFTISKQPLL